MTRVMDVVREPRNHVIDAARAASIVVVVVFHALLYEVRLVDGRPALVPWAPTHVPWWPLSWLLMVIPVFFIAGGYANALLVDRMRQQGTTYAHFLANRGRRLIGPLILFVTVLALASTVAAWLGYADVVIPGTRQLMQLLWFISVYLVIVAVAPWAVAAHERWGWRPMLVAAVAAAGVDTWSFATDEFWLRNLNMLLVWPLAHQLGIAYHRGWFRTGHALGAVLALAGGVSGIAVLVFGFGYPGSAVGLADIPIANVQPPTLAMGFLALAQCGALALVERAGWLRDVSGRVQRALALVNALMMTAYLWHIGCIALAAGALLALSIAAPAASGIVLSQASVAVLSLAIVVAVVPLLGRIEYRLIPPLGEHQDGRIVVVAYAILVLGTGIVWQTGTVLHPASPGSTAGVGLVWLGSWLMRRAANA